MQRRQVYREGDGIVNFDKFDRQKLAESIIKLKVFERPDLIIDALQNIKYYDYQKGKGPTTNAFDIVVTATRQINLLPPPGIHETANLMDFHVEALSREFNSIIEESKVGGKSFIDMYMDASDSVLQEAQNKMKKNVMVVSPVVISRPGRRDIFMSVLLTWKRQMSNILLPMERMYIPTLIICTVTHRFNNTNNPVAPVIKAFTDTAIRVRLMNPSELPNVMGQIIQMPDPEEFDVWQSPFYLLLLHFALAMRPGSDLSLDRHEDNALIGKVLNGQWLYRLQDIYQPGNNWTQSAGHIQYFKTLTSRFLCRLYMILNAKTPSPIELLASTTKFMSYPVNAVKMSAQDMVRVIAESTKVLEESDPDQFETSHALAKQHMDEVMRGSYYQYSTGSRDSQQEYDALENHVESEINKSASIDISDEAEEEISSSSSDDESGGSDDDDDDEMSTSDE